LKSVDYQLNQTWNKSTLVKYQSGFQCSRQLLIE